MDHLKGPPAPIPPGGVVLGQEPKGAKKHGSMEWDPTDADLVRHKSCPFSSGPIGTAGLDANRNVAMIALPKYVPCHRKCALFVKDDTHPDKGYCCFVPPYLAGAKP